MLYFLLPFIQYKYKLIYFVLCELIYVNIEEQANFIFVFVFYRAAVKYEDKGSIIERITCLRRGDIQYYEGAIYSSRSMARYMTRWTWEFRDGTPLPLTDKAVSLHPVYLIDFPSREAECLLLEFKYPVRYLPSRHSFPSSGCFCPMLPI